MIIFKSIYFLSICKITNHSSFVKHQNIAEHAEPYAELRGTKRRTTLLLYENESYLIRGACFDIYKKFRNTQKESVYQRSLLEDLKSKGLKAEREKQLPVYHLGTKVGIYTPDLIVNGTIIIELKAKPFLHREDIRQFWYYLKNSEFTLGFLINFGEPNGVKIVRRIYEKARAA